MSSSLNVDNGFDSLTNLVKQINKSWAIFGKRFENIESNRFLNQIPNQRDERIPAFESIGVSEELGFKVERILKKNKDLKNTFQFLKRTWKEKHLHPRFFIDIFQDFFYGMIMTMWICTIKE